MTLTPFERAQAGHEKTALISATITATRKMVDLGEECAEQISAFRKLLLLGPDGKALRDEERGITAEAMKDAKMVNHAIVTLADTLEQAFGISA
jgi:hypothetical protein